MSAERNKFWRKEKLVVVVQHLLPTTVGGKEQRSFAGHALAVWCAPLDTKEEEEAAPERRFLSKGIVDDVKGRRRR